LLDLMMPGMDGYDVLHALAEEASLATRHAYILFSTMSTYHARQVAERFKSLNVTSLRKPFDLDDLLAAVQKAASGLQ
jgi:CheY-like chemotaxis protein